MANGFYTAPADKTPLTTIGSAAEDSNSAALEAAFDKLPSEVDLKRNQFGTDGSTIATLYKITITDLSVAYYAGLEIVFEATFANTGAASVQINAGAIASLVDAAGNALAAGAIQVGQVVTVVYTSASVFQLLVADTASASAAASAASAAAALVSENNAAASAATLDDVTQHFHRNT